MKYSILLIIIPLILTQTNLSGQTVTKDLIAIDTAKKSMQRTDQPFSLDQYSRPEKLSYSYFKANLIPSMGRDSILCKFGHPSADIGSGIYIYVYELVDSTQMIIGFTDKIHYALHYDKNRKLLHDLFPRPNQDPYQIKKKRKQA